MDIAVKYSESILSIAKVLEVLGLPRSSFYYKPVLDKGKSKGRTLSEYTLKISGEKVSNIKVVEDIKKLLGEEFVDYGYLKVTYHLRQELRYIINPKKVYNLMKINNLLNPKPTHSSKLRREWVKELVPKPELDFSYLEFDIKYFYRKAHLKIVLLFCQIFCIFKYIKIKHLWIIF